MNKTATDATKNDTSVRAAEDVAFVLRKQTGASDEAIRQLLDRNDEQYIQAAMGHASGEDVLRFALEQQQRGASVRAAPSAKDGGVVLNIERSARDVLTVRLAGSTVTVIGPDRTKQICRDGSDVRKALELYEQTDASFENDVESFRNYLNETVREQDYDLYTDVTDLLKQIEQRRDRRALQKLQKQAGYN